MLKTIGLSEELVSKTFRTDHNRFVSSCGSRANETIKNSSRKSTRELNVKAIGKPNFLTPNAKKAFNYL